jgi:hypothetical protein
MRYLSNECAVISAAYTYGILERKMGVEALSDLRQEIVLWVRMLHTLLII